MSKETSPVEASGTTVTYSEKAPAEAGALHFLRQQSRPSLSSSSNSPAP